MLELTRIFHFCSGHRLFRPEWDSEKNSRVFGLCANPAGHGHNYILEVSISGPIDPETGMIMNLRDLKEIIETQVIADVDHKNLNVDVPWMANTIPTTEVFAERIWHRVEGVLTSCNRKLTLERIVLRETPNNVVTRTRKDTK